MLKFIIAFPSSDTLLLRFSYISRFVLALFSGLFFAVAFIGDRTVWTALVIAVLCLLAALYTERWVVKSRTAVRFVGVWPVLTKKTVDLQALEHVALTVPKEFIMDLPESRRTLSGGTRAYRNLIDFRVVQVAFVMQGGDIVTVHTESLRKKDHMVHIADALAQFLSVPRKTEET